MVLYKGSPVFYQGKPILEHEYFDWLMEKLLEANDLSRQGADVAWLHFAIVPRSRTRNPVVRSVIRIDSEL